jgi:NAD(P) transhydrogenase subunit beta
MTVATMPKPATKSEKPGAPTMKALVYQAIGKKALVDHPKPVITAPTDAIVRITKTTICGTDLHILKGDLPSCEPGRILGHEGIGIVEQVGSAVTVFKTGDHVLISCVSACGQCVYCRKQMYSHCTTGGWILGNTIDGTQAEFVRIPHADMSLYPIPKDADEEALVMLSDILPTSFECGVLNGNVEPGSVVAIVGAGPIGLAALLTAQFYSPAEIIMIDLDDNRLEVAKRFGATSTVNSTEGNAAEAVMKLTGKRGVDTAIEAVGMPQMVALYNGMGGGAAGAIAAVELFGNKTHGATQLSVTLLGALIGAVSLSGSLIAWAKLQGVIKKPLRFGGQQVFNLLVLLATVAIGGYLIFVAQSPSGQLLPTTQLITLFFAIALIFGILMTLPIGGADMPVVISIYNAATGLAVGLEGFVLENPALMIAGMVVGAAGLLLTLLMARAMNRSVANVLLSNFGGPSKHKPTHIKGSLKPTQAADAGIFMRYAQSVIIVPGYGLAAAQAQQKLYEFVKLLQAAGVSVKFAIHPVAGRMPGQMDVLLAEAGVPYDMIFQLDDINDELKTTDVALVIGANDVVNPAARTDKSSPIFGMPILNADQAKQVYVVKRGEGKGYAGIVNALFYADNCNMVYGDAAVVMSQMIDAVHGLGAKAAA